TGCFHQGALSPVETTAPQLAHLMGHLLSAATSRPLATRAPLSPPPISERPDQGFRSSFSQRTVDGRFFSGTFPPPGWPEKGYPHSPVRHPGRPFPGSAPRRLLSQ